MKKLYVILKIAMGCIGGTFIGSSIFQYYDYITHPDIYMLQSAPWYLSIQIRGIFTAIAFAVILIIMAVIRKRIK